MNIPDYQMYKKRAKIQGRTKTPPIRSVLYDAKVKGKIR